MNLLNDFLTSLIGVQNDFPVSLEVILKDVQNEIVIPNVYKNPAEMLSKSFGRVLDGKSRIDSIANICSIFCLVFVDCDNKYLDKNIWLNMIKEVQEYVK